MSFFNFDFTSVGDEDDLQIIAFGAVQFPSNTTTVSNQEVSLGDIFEGIVNLKPGGRYFLVNNYEGVANSFRHLYDQDISYTQITALAFVNGRWFFGFGNSQEEGRRNIPVMRMKIRLDPTVATDDQPLSEIALNIYPNPVSTQLSVAVDLERSGPGLIIMTNAEGKIMLWQKYERLHQENLTFDLTAFPAGQYYIRLGTKDGTKTLPFVIAR